MRAKKMPRKGIKSWRVGEATFIGVAWDFLGGIVTVNDMPIRRWWLRMPKEISIPAGKDQYTLKKREGKKHFVLRSSDGKEISSL